MRERFNDLAGQVTEGYNVARKSAARGMRGAYNTAQEYPGTIAAIVVGLGVTAFMLRAVRRAGGWHGTHQERGIANRGVISSSIMLARSA